ncbi:MAG: hypothetical protein ACFFE5_11010 [Candidatus Thorarchaeota archaeon]
MAIIYHFANPDIVNLIWLFAFIILTVAGYNLKRRNEGIKNTNLFLISGIIGTAWFIIIFLIPAYMFTTPPTPTEIQFTYLYSLVWHSLVPSLILIVILGIINIILGLGNKENYGLWLLLSGILFIVFTLLDLIPTISPLSDIILGIIISMGMVLSSCFYLYFSLKLKNTYLIVFSVLFLISIISIAIGLNLYIPIF